MKKLSLSKETVQLLDARQTEAMEGAAERYSFQFDCPSHVATCGRATICRTKWYWC